MFINNTKLCLKMKSIYRKKIFECYKNKYVKFIVDNLHNPLKIAERIFGKKRNYIFKSNNAVWSDI